MSFKRLSRPYVIAEIGGNHEGNFEYARKLLKDAVETGVHAIKFQTYTADRIVNKIQAPDRNKHFSRFELTIDQYIELAKLCEQNGKSFMTSIWDLESIELLDPYIEVHKVGSGDLTNYCLLKPLAETGKPLCIATAMATLDEALATVKFIRSVNPELVASGNLCVMHCVAMYGEPLDEFANLNAIKTLRENMPLEVAVGYSDHTSGNVAVKVAAEFGAFVIETHFTDDNTREFRDHHFAHNKHEMADFMEYCRRRSVMLGSGNTDPVAQVETDERIKQFRRACYFTANMKSGDVATKDNLTTLRPMEGLPATDYFNIVGKRLVRDKEALSTLSWDDFD